MQQHYIRILYITIALSYYDPRTVVFSSLYHRGFIIVLSWFHHSAIVTSLSSSRIIIIILSRFTIGLSFFHHSAIALSPLCYGIIIYHAIIFTPSYYRVFVIVLSHYYQCTSAFIITTLSSFHHRSIAFRCACLYTYSNAITLPIFQI